MERGLAKRRDRRRILTGTAFAGVLLSLAGSATAGTFFGQGFRTNATVDNPFGGPVTDSNESGEGFSTPPSAPISGVAEAVVFDPNNPIVTLVGGAFASGTAQAGDRFTKFYGGAGLNMLTGDAYGQGYADWQATGVAGNDAVADLGVFYDRSLGYSDTLGYAGRMAQVETLANLNYNSPSSALAFQLFTVGSLRVRVEEVESGVYWDNLLVEGIVRKFEVQTLNGAALVTGDGADRAFGYSIYQTTVNGLIERTETQNPFSLDNSAPDQISYSRSSIFGLSNLIFRSGRTYNVSLSGGCIASVTALAGVVEAPEVDSYCNASNSAYWLGLRNFRNLGGAPIGAITLASNDTGLDLAGPSPSAPNVAPIPEPATWALMIGGFGLAGAALRRRRAVAA